MISMPSRNWIILRTSGRNTLALAETLGKQFPVWTPQWMRRVPRRRDEQQSPLLPTFVFGDSDYVRDFYQIAKTTIKACPDFSVFHYLDRIPIVADCELDPLRWEEDRSKRRQAQKQANTFNRGETVTTDVGGFQGMSGVVERTKGKFAVVLFGGREVKIASFLLASAERKAA